MLPATVRIFVCTQRQDMRRSFDALAQLTREVLGQDPQSGALFVFVGKKPSRVKVLWWDQNGYCILAKRFHRAICKLPERDHGEAALQIDAKAFAELIAGIVCEKKHTKALTLPLH